MKCDEVRELMPDLAVGSLEPSAEIQSHLNGCGACSGLLTEFRQTMHVLDEWQVAEPTPYFDTRLNARMREEQAKETSRQGWFAWLRRPAFAAAATVLVAAGVGLAGWKQIHRENVAAVPAVVENTSVVVSTTAPTGTAVSDLQTLDQDSDLYADFDVLDNVDGNQNRQANP